MIPCWRDVMNSHLKNVSCWLDISGTETLCKLPMIRQILITLSRKSSLLLQASVESGVCDKTKAKAGYRMQYFSLKKSY